MKRIYSLLAGIFSVLLLSTTVSAHVVVKPGEVPTSTYQAFTVSVPNEKALPTISVKLLIPKSVESITPTVKPGWTIDIEKEGTGDEARIVSVTWSGGTIGEGLRDDFGFTAKTPDQAGNIEWKAYQTYSDGTVVSWDKASHDADGHEEEGSNSGPLSVTKVTEEQTTNAINSDTVNNDMIARSIGIVSLVISLALFAFVSRKHSAKK